MLEYNRNPTLPAAKRGLFLALAVPLAMAASFACGVRTNDHEGTNKPAGMPSLVVENISEDASGKKTIVCRLTNPTDTAICYHESKFGPNAVPQELRDGAWTATQMLIDLSGFALKTLPPDSSIAVRFSAARFRSNQRIQMFIFQCDGGEAIPSSSTEVYTQPLTGL